MKYEVFKENTHKHIKNHFKNDKANNFTDDFLEKCFASKTEVYDFFGGETVLVEIDGRRSIDEIKDNMLKYLNSKTNDPNTLLKIRDKIVEIVTEFEMLRSRNILNDELRFVNDYQGARVGQKYSKFLASKFNNLDDDLSDIFKKSNSKLNEIISASNTKLYLRMSCSMDDYLKLGFQLQPSCTRIYPENTPHKRYAKAVFTYAQNSTFVATLYGNEEDATSRSDNALVRQIFYVKGDVMLGMRKYGHAQEYLNTMTREMNKFFRENGIYDDSKYLINLKNKKAVNYRAVKNEILDNNFYKIRYDDIGYIDTFHYTEACGDILFHNINYEALEFQNSIFDVEYDFDDDPENRILHKNDMKEKLTSIYKSFMDDISSHNLIVPYNNDRFNDYRNFELDDDFYCCVHERVDLHENLVVPGAQLDN